MPHINFSGALNAAVIPLLASLQPRTVVQPQLDNVVRNAKGFYGSEESAVYSIPQLLYCENVVPTAEGIQSVGYDKIIEGLPDATDFDQAITLRDSDENNFLFVPANGKNYIYTANNGEWQATDSFTGWTGKLITRAYVNGRTFICYEGQGIYEYDTSAGTFTKQNIIGLADADVRGIGASSNYLIAFTELEVHWSSLVDPLDFVPSLTTGAGFSIPQDVKARITAVVQISGGFVIYTAKNAVAAVFTNNTRSPFTFKEISNAGGILSYEQVTSENNPGPHYAWTTGGLQKITIQGAETVSAEINDFIAGRKYDIFDPISKTIKEFKSTAAEFSVKVTYISSRFLIISYGVGSTENFNYAIFYDTVLKRYGKLKIDHVDCFSYPYPNLFGDLTWDNLVNTSWDDLEDTTWEDLTNGIVSDPPSKLACAFLQQDGTVKLLRMDYNKEYQQEGIAIFGKFQLTRQRLIQLQEVEIEGSYEDSITDFHMYAIASIDGKNATIVQPMKLLKVAGLFSHWAKRITGVNIWLVAIGTFAFSSYILTVVQEGDR